MNQSSKINLVQFMDKFNDIFTNVNTSDFLNKLLHNEDYWSLISGEQRQEIEEMIKLMVLNARVEETRKEQQNFFYPVLAILNKPNVKEHFETDKQFKGAFLALSLIFLGGFHGMSHGDESHHEFIMKNLKEAIGKIIN